MAVILLGIDALDWWLVDDSGADTLRLSTSSEIESFAYTFDDRPHTLDVWPSVATGNHPREHGVDADGEWDNRFVELGSRVVGSIESTIGTFPGVDQLESVAEETVGASWEAGTIDGLGVFEGDGREVQNWPGVKRNEMMFAARDILKTDIHDGSATKDEFTRRIKAEARGKFAWVKEMMQSDTVLVANQVHIADCAGHAFADDKERLYEMYHWIANQVEEIRSQMDATDTLLILSDHGMETEWKCEHRTPADHSWRPIVSSTEETVPQSVFDVREWVESRIPQYSRSSQRATVPEEQLEDLGYL